MRETLHDYFSRSETGYVRIAYAVALPAKSFALHVRNSGRRKRELTHSRRGRRERKGQDRTGQDALEVSVPRWNEIQRILISRPIGVTPFDGHKVPRPHLQDGSLVQVNAYVSDTGEIVERWLLSETDERWYKLEAWRDKWVTLKMAKRVAISG